MIKFLPTFLIFNLCFFFINAQNKSFYPEGTKRKNTQLNLNKGEIDKNDYQYKNYFYTALKEKSIFNFDQAIKYFEKCISIDKNRSAPYYEISRIYFEQDKINQSLINAKAAYSLNPKNKWYALFYAETLFSNKNFYDAIKVYKDLIKQYPEDENYYIELALCYIYNNDLKGAIRTYNVLEELKGINYYISTQKYKIYIELKDFKRASKELEMFLLEYPYNVEIYQMLSDCYILDNNFDKSFEVLKKITEINPGSAGIHLQLAEFYFKKGNTSEYHNELIIAFKSKKLDAQTKVRKIIPMLTPIYEKKYEEFDIVLELSKILAEVHPEDEMSNYIYADLLRLNKDFNTSIKYYEKVVEINPNQQDAWIDLLFLQLQTNLIKDLIIYSEKGIELFPTNPTFYYLNGLAYFYDKQYEKTIEAINIGVNFVFDNPTLSSEMYSILGNTFNELEDYINSDKSYDKALSFLPDNTIVLNNYAYYLSLRGEELEKAKKMSKKTIEIFPEEANYLDTYAWILYQMKDYESAKIFMIKAIEISESKTFYIHLSDILIELGEFDEAEIYRLKAKDFDDE